MNLDTTFDTTKMPAHMQFAFNGDFIDDTRAGYQATILMLRHGTAFNCPHYNSKRASAWFIGGMVAAVRHDRPVKDVGPKIINKIREALALN